MPSQSSLSPRRFRGEAEVDGGTIPGTGASCERWAARSAGPGRAGRGCPGQGRGCPGGLIRPPPPLLSALSSRGAPETQLPVPSPFPAPFPVARPRHGGSDAGSRRGYIKGRRQRAEASGAERAAGGGRLAVLAGRLPQPPVFRPGHGFPQHSRDGLGAAGAERGAGELGGCRGARGRGAVAVGPGRAPWPREPCPPQPPPRQLPPPGSAGPFASPAGVARFWGLEKCLCVGRGRAGPLLSTGAGTPALGAGGRGLRLLVGQCRDPGSTAVVRGKAAAKNRLCPFVCSENTSLPRLICESETK